MRMDNWYVLHVRTGQEMGIAEAVRKLPGAAALVPSVILTERRDGKREECSRLLYPGYVFAQTERLNAQRYYDFKRIDGVLRLLGLDDGDIPRCAGKRNANGNGYNRRYPDGRNIPRYQGCRRQDKDYRRTLEKPSGPYHQDRYKAAARNSAPKPDGAHADSKCRSHHKQSDRAGG